MQPLTNIEEDDEKADLEYDVAEPVPIDKQELRPMRVSERERNQLIRATRRVWHLVLGISSTIAVVFQLIP